MSDPYDLPVPETATMHFIHGSWGYDEDHWSLHLDHAHYYHKCNEACFKVKLVRDGGGDNDGS